MRPIIKICGLTDRAAIDAAAFAGATEAGFNFFPRSPRYVSPEQARALVVGCPPELNRVAVMVDPDDAAVDAAVAAIGAQALQLHGRETPERVAALKTRTHLTVIKALPVASAGDVAVAAHFGAADIILFDAKPPAGADRTGGHGAVFDWSALAALKTAKPWLLSGGLHAGNVVAAITATRPPGVDVSSGVESAPGVKDGARIVAFCAAAGSAFEALVLEPQA